MEIKNFKTLELINELATRTGIIKTSKTPEADVTNLVDVINETETITLGICDTVEEVINSTEIIMDRIREGWVRVDHWMDEDDLIVVLKPSEVDAS